MNGRIFTHLRLICHKITNPPSPYIRDVIYVIAHLHVTHEIDSFLLNLPFHFHKYRINY